MDKNILKVVIADNQLEVPRYKVIPRDFTFGGIWELRFCRYPASGKVLPAISTDATTTGARCAVG